MVSKSNSASPADIKSVVNVIQSIATQHPLTPTKNARTPISGPSSDEGQKKSRKKDKSSVLNNIKKEKPPVAEDKSEKSPSHKKTPKDAPVAEQKSHKKTPIIKPAPQKTEKSSQPRKPAEKLVTKQEPKSTDSKKIPQKTVKRRVSTLHTGKHRLVSKVYLGHLIKKVHASLLKEMGRDPQKLRVNSQAFQVMEAYSAQQAIKYGARTKKVTRACRRVTSRPADFLLVQDLIKT